MNWSCFASGECDARDTLAKYTEALWVVQLQFKFHWCLAETSVNAMSSAYKRKCTCTSDEIGTLVRTSVLIFKDLPRLRS